MPTCRELGIGIIAYGPMSRGLLTGRVSLESMGPTDFRRYASPQFSAESMKTVRLAFCLATCTCVPNYIMLLCFRLTVSNISFMAPHSIASGCNGVQCGMISCQQQGWCMASNVNFFQGGQLHQYCSSSCVSLGGLWQPSAPSSTTVCFHSCSCLHQGVVIN